MNTFCTYYNQGLCRSCDELETEYSVQIRKKEEKLLKFMSGLRLPPLEETVTSLLTQFRNKAKFSVTGTVSDPIIGLTGIEKLDEGRELLNCPLHLPEINDLLPAIKTFITLAHLVPYQISQKKGELKGIIIYFSEESKEGYLRFILRSKESLDRIRKHLPLLQAEFPSLKCITANIQPIPHAILEGDEEIYFDEKKYISNVAGGIRYFLGPQGFVQTNQKVAARLYETAAQWVKEVNGKKFLELFCGQGAFSFFSSSVIEQGMGIEINAEAIQIAQLTAEDYPHLNFEASDASKVGSIIENFHPDIILVNPPRRGIAAASDLIAKSPARYFIYSSCNAESLAEDLKKLTDSFSIERIQIFDMFPHTSHFETLVLLKRLS